MSCEFNGGRSASLHFGVYVTAIWVLIILIHTITMDKRISKIMEVLKIDQQEEAQ